MHLFSCTGFVFTLFIGITKARVILLCVNNRAHVLFYQLIIVVTPFDTLIPSDPLRLR